MALPYVYAAGISPEVVAGTTLVLAANGGTVAIPFMLADDLICQSIVARTTDTTGSHTLELVFFGDAGQLPRLGTFQSLTFTAAAAAVRAGQMAAPVSLSSGIVWLLVRNSGVTTTTLSAVASGTLALNHCVTQTLGASLSTGAPLTGWTPSSVIPLVRLNGSMYGIGQAGI